MKKHFIFLILVVVILSSVMSSVNADSYSYIGSASSSFYTTGRIVIINDRYYADENTYARMGSSSGSSTAYTSKLILYKDANFSVEAAHDTENIVSGGTHSWHWTGSIESGYSQYYLKLKVTNMNAGYKTYVSGQVTSE